MKMKAFIQIIAVCALSVFTGCATKPVSVESSLSEEQILDRYQSILTGDRISKGTEATLVKLGLLEEYQEDPVLLSMALYAISTPDDDWEFSFARAEVARQVAEMSQGNERQKALLEAAVAAAHAIQKANNDPSKHLHPSFLLAVEMYNNSVGLLFESLQETQGHPSNWRTISGLTHEYDIAIEMSGYESLTFFDRYKFTDTLEFSGLRNRHQTFGIGASLVAIKEPKEGQPFPYYLPPEGLIYPVTLLLKDNGPKLTFKLINPRISKQTDFYGSPLPLAADFTTPYATLLNQTELHSLEDTGFFDPDSALHHLGLFLLEPYDPNKIPLIMVHGLWGSPLTWRELTNEVWGDEILRENFQVWHFMYPTGGPIVDNAYELRRAITSLRKILGESTEDPALQEMVIVAHSMGGVVSRATLVSSGDALWDTQFKQPVEELPLSEKEKYILQETFFFEALPWVSRAIFIAAPHRGSSMADSFIGRLGISLVSTPKRFKDILTRIHSDNPDALRDEDPVVPTSIDTLSPNNQVLQALANLPLRTDLKYHSIIGDEEGGEAKTDGIVTYESSHLEGAESEIIIDGDHYINKHPKAIREVRRILHQHIKEKERN